MASGGSGRLAGMTGPRGFRAFVALVAGIAVVAIIGLVVLWPDGSSDVELGAGPSGESEKGTVEAVQSLKCPPPAVGTCIEGEVLIESGPETGELVPVEFSAGGPSPDFEVGDQVRITKADFGPEGTYSVVDFERRAPMIWLAAFFVLLVLLFGRLRGALSLLGLAISLAVVLVFIVPAILDGRPPLAVAIVGSVAVMLVTILLAHGTGPKSMAAILGTVGSLLLVGILAVIFTNLTNLTGFSSEQAAILATNESGISVRGLLIAGMVIGALGVLDDVTVSQSSTVMALKAANPDLGFRQLYSRAIEVGRDHVSATVNTLVLAYVGSSLPVLLIFGATDLGVVDTVNLELVAKEIVATLVGSIGIIAAVPLTTALAALLAGSLGRDELESAGAGAHHH